MNRRGFTLVEFVIVAIIAVLLVLGFLKAVGTQFPPVWVEAERAVELPC